MADEEMEDNIPVPPINSNQFQHVAQVLQLLNVGAEFTHQRDRKRKVNETLKETPTLVQACFRYIGKNSELMKGSQFNVPEEISNELLAYLIQNKCLNKHNLNLVLSNESSALKTLSLEKYGGLPEDALQQLAIASSLQGLSLRGCFCVSDATLQIIAQGCSALTSLDISDLPRITSASLQHISLYCTNLKSLHAKRCMNISGAIDWKSPSITTLGLGGTKVTSLTLSAPLEIVDCADCSYLTHLQWTESSEVGPNLSKLNMFECENLSSGNFEILSERLINLESLTLSNNTFLVDSDLKGISQNCKKLKNLFVNSCDHVTDVGMEYVTMLKDLETISFPKVSDRPIVEIATRENNLKTIDICQNRNLHNDGPRAILKNCKKLFALSLAGCRFVTDEAFSEISENLDSLQNLNLMNVTQLTDAAMRTIGEKFKNLSALDLYKNANVTDTGLSHILMGCGNALKRLYLQYCIMIGDETLGNIGKMCPNLEYLDVYGNNQFNVGINKGDNRVTIEGVKIVLRKNLELNELNVDTKLREEAMMWITVGNVGK